MPQFDADSALKAGYSEDEVLKHLTSTRKFDVDGAVKAGHSKSDIIHYLSAKPAIAQSLLDSRKAASTSEFNKNQPPEDAVSRFREARIATTEPFALQNILPVAKAGLKELFTSKKTDTEKVQAIWDLTKSMAHGVADPVVNYAKDAWSGDWNKAAYDSGQILTNTVPAVAGVVDTVREQIPVGAFKEKLRAVMRSAVGASPFKTTEPLLKKYGEAATAATEEQSAADTSTREANTSAIDKTQQKSRVQQAEYDKESAAARSKNRLSETENQQAARDAKEAGEKKKAAIQKNAEGSKKTGELTKDFEAKTKLEADEKYAPIHAATAGDPGVSLEEIAGGAKSIEKGAIKGSVENIKQFRDLVKKAKGAEGMDFLDNLDGTLSEAGEINVEAEGTEPPPMLKYDQLRGYSTELGQALAKGADVRHGGLPGDVRMAVKQLKAMIDDASQVIAERNGVGPQAKDASAYWSARQELLYDSDSALSQVRKRVGVLDPQFYSEPFTTGKAAGVAIDRLRKFPTRHTAEATTLADLAENLKKSHVEVKSTPSVKPPKPPKAVADPEPPKPLTTPLESRRVIAQPDQPTVGDLKDAWKQKIGAKADAFKEIHWRDPLILASSLAAITDPVRAIEIAAGGIVGPKVLGAALDIEGVKNWIARPVAGDVEAAMKLPEPARSALVKNLQQIIDQERAAGRPLTVSGPIQRLLSVSGVRPVTNRQEGLDLFKQE